MHPSLATRPSLDLPVDRARNWLLLMSHPSACRGGSSCPIAREDCERLKVLRSHVEKCRLPSCPVANCDTARSVLRHHFVCRDNRCPICHSITFSDEQNEQSNGWYEENERNGGVETTHWKYQHYLHQTQNVPLYTPLVVPHFQQHQFSTSYYYSSDSPSPQWYILPSQQIYHAGEPQAATPTPSVINRAMLTPHAPPAPAPPKRHLIARTREARSATDPLFKEGEIKNPKGKDKNRFGHAICAETLANLKPEAPAASYIAEDFGDEAESAESDYDTSVACQFPFLVKLRDIVADPANSSIIAWNARRRVLEVLNKERLETEVMPKYFTTHGPKARFTSFLRQLNNYGFENTLSGRKGQPIYKNVDESIATVEDFTRVRKVANKKSKKKRRASCFEDDVAAVDLVLALSKQRSQKQFR